MKIAVLNGGGRNDGNTEMLAKRLVEGTDATWFDLKNYTIDAIVDERHDEDGFHSVNDDYDSLMKEVMAHDVLIFATPIYWYSMTASMKLFIDRWSQTMRQPEYEDFRERMSGKKAFVTAVGGDQPHTKGLPMIMQFKQIFDFVQLPMEGYIIGQAHKPGDILKDVAALDSADRWNQQFKLSGK
ncbi:flavodoxin family protein [Halobacillus litoralis]|uniref:flavodoxin family protein n=1 Tax=Halobacillus litoralis TaxID=45668 RepID=UPI001CD614AF|nr:flavodoxin family protein [Halobacillus litoralis]MCA0969270.1 flavodoxin family protein [Halobacillus litoralis]